MSPKTGRRLLGSFGLVSFFLLTYLYMLAAEETQEILTPPAIDVVAVRSNEAGTPSSTATLFSLIDDSISLGFGISVVCGHDPTTPREEVIVASSQQASREKGFGPLRPYSPANGLFTMDMPSSWQVDALNEESDRTYIRAFDPRGYAWLQVHVIEFGRSLDRAELEKILRTYIDLDWSKGIEGFEQGEKAAVQADESLQVMFQGYRRDTDKFGTDLDNAILGYAFIQQRAGRVGIYGMDLMRLEFDAKRAEAFRLLRTFRLSDSGARTAAPSSQRIRKFGIIVPPAGAPTQGLYALEGLIGFNVLDRVTFEPRTGRITLAGHKDEKYGEGPIPYLDHLAELLKNSSPELTLNWTPGSSDRTKALFRKFDSKDYVEGLVRQWTNIMDAGGHPSGAGRWLLPLIGVNPTFQGGRLGYLGADAQEFAQTLRNTYERLRVSSVTPGSPAAKAGLRAGDVIINYANAAKFEHDIRLAGEDGTLTLQIWRTGQDLANPIVVTLGGRAGDPWAELDKYDIVQKMLWAAGNDKAAILTDSLAEFQRISGGPSKAGLQGAFLKLVAMAGYNDQYYSDVAEYQAGRISESEGQSRTFRAIFSAIESAFSFDGRPLTSTFDASRKSGFNPADAFDRTLLVLNELIAPYLERLMQTLLAKNEEIQVPPEIMQESVGATVEASPEFRGVDPRSALARLMFDADILGKSLLNRPALGQRIRGYQTDFAFERNHPERAGPWHSSADYHLWFSIDGFDLSRSEDGQTLFTRGAKMRINVREKAPDGSDAPAVPGSYEELLTSLYDRLAAEFPVLHDLREAAKLKAAVEWLKSKKPDLRFPDSGRISKSVPERTPGTISFIFSPQERPGRLAAALSAMGGVTLRLKAGSLDLIRAPKDIIGPYSPAVVLNQDAVAISILLSMPIGASGPEPIGWVAAGSEEESIGMAVSFIPPRTGDLPASVPLRWEAAGQAATLWRADDLDAAKKLSEEHIQRDLQHYRNQSQKTMADIDRIYVPTPGAGNVIDEGVLLGLFSPESQAKKLIGVKSPFSGRPYKEGEVFASAASGDISEALRGLMDNASLGEFTLNTPHGKELIEKLQGKHFKRLLAHSNGATIAEALIRKGVIRVDELNLLGGDRSDVNEAGLQELIDSGKVKKVTVWNNPGDLVPKGSSWLLPTPVNMTGSIPLTAIAGNIIRTMTGMERGGKAAVEYPKLVGDQFKGQKLIRLEDMKNGAALKAYLDDTHAVQTYIENLTKYLHPDPPGLNKMK